MTVTTTTRGRGRPAVFADKFGVVDALAALAGGKAPSRYLLLKLVEMGFVATRTVKSEGRGRPRVEFDLTGKGRGRLALSKNWKR